jgi:hypothetical protein
VPAFNPLINLAGIRLIDHLLNDRRKKIPRPLKDLPSVKEGKLLDILSPEKVRLYSKRSIAL